MTPVESLQSLLISQRRENEGSLEGSLGDVGPSSSLGLSDYQEPVETEQFEDDKILGQLQPPQQLGKDAQVLCMTRPHNISGEFMIEFGVVNTELDNISLWLKAPENVQCVFIVLPLCILILPPSLDFSQARCISLVCYYIEDIGPHAIQQGDSREHEFENLRPVLWTKIPPVLSFSMNDAVTHLFPAYEVRLRRIL